MSTQRTMSGSGRRLVAAGLTAAMALAACGGGGDDDSAATTPTTEPPSADTTEPEPPSTTAAPATTAAATTTPASTEPATPDTTEPTEPAGPVTVVSDDGNVAMVVSAADAERVNPTVRVLDPSEWPPELGSAEQLPGVTIYEMEPDGAEFDEPVVVTRRLDVSAFGDTLTAGEVPIVVPFTQEADGAFVPLDDLEVTRVGDALYVAGTTTHFSPFATVDTGANAQFLGGEALAAAGSVGPVDDRFAEGGFTGENVVWADGTPVLRSDLIQVLPPSGELPSLTTGFAPTDGTVPSLAWRTDPPQGASPAFDPMTVSPQAEPNRSGLVVPDLRTLRSHGNGFPPSPLFASEESLAVSAAMLFIQVSEEAGDETLALAYEAARQLAAVMGLEVSVVHMPKDQNPSYTRLRTSNTEQVQDVTLFGFNYTGEFGPSAKVIDITPMEWTGDGYVGDVGLATYGPVRNGLFVVPNGQVIAPDGAVPQSLFDRYLAAQQPAILATEAVEVTAAEDTWELSPEELEFFSNLNP